MGDNYQISHKPLEDLRTLGVIGVVLCTLRLHVIAALPHGLVAASDHAAPRLIYEPPCQHLDLLNLPPLARQVSPSALL